MKSVSSDAFITVLYYLLVLICMWFFILLGWRGPVGRGHAVMTYCTRLGEGRINGLCDELHCKALYIGPKQ